MSLKIGKEYLIEHSRKGQFYAKLIEDTGDFIKVKITKGRANFISAMNAGMGVVGDHISIRKSFCTFKEIEE